MANGLRDRDNAVEIGENTAEIGNNAAGISDNAISPWKWSHAKLHPEFRLE